MRVSFARAWVAVAMLSAAAPVMAQTPPDKIPEVVVQGSRAHVDPARQFVDSVTAEVEDKNGDRQIAQFADAICPYSLGLPKALNLAISQRIVQIAKDAGLRTGGAGCDPNLVVIVADTGRQFLDKLHAAHPAIFGAMDWREIDSLLQEDGPVHTWQIQERLGRDGMPLGPPDGPGSEEPVNSLSPLLPYEANYLWSPSVIKKGVRQTIDSSFVVIDAKAVDGLTVAQIADYAAMRTLAVTRAPKRGAGGKETILTLFDEGNADKPEHLSATDAAYLHALYATSNALSGTMQRTSIANIIRTSLDSTAPSQ